jgi:putative hydrolase of HD superfamily
LAGYDLRFGAELQSLWLEYEAQITPESHWVKVLDRLMPFVVNLATNGKRWRDQSIARSQVLDISKPIHDHAPELYGWMVERTEECVKAGWLRDA